MRTLALLALVVGLVVAAGAVPSAGASSAIATTGTTATSTATTTAATTATTTTGNNSTAESPVTDLAMFTVNDPSPPPLTVGFSVVNDNEFGFAAYVDGEFVGGTEFMSLGQGSIVDGYEVPVEANVTGEHQATVYAVQDSNDNGVVDAEDEPYTRDGAPVNTTWTVTFDSSGGVSNLAFYTDYDDDPRPIRVRYTVERNTTVAFALYADGELVGHTEYEHYERTLHADGLEVPLERNLTGDAELTVVALQDANGNGEVDDGDEPYRDDGQRVASTLTFDFGSGTGTTGNETTGTGTTGNETTTGDDVMSTSTNTGTVPGFGLIAAATAFTVAVLAKRGR